MKHKNIGSSFDDFLKENDIFEHAEDVATKRVIAFQLMECHLRSKMDPPLLIYGPTAKVADLADMERISPVLNSEPALPIKKETPPVFSVRPGS